MMNQRGRIQLRFVTLSLIFCGTSCAPVDEPASFDKPSISPSTAGQHDDQQIPDAVVRHPDELLRRVEASMLLVEQRDVLISNGFWTVTHGILGCGTQLTLYNPDTGQRVNALDYIYQGGPIRGLRFIPTSYGLDVQNGPLYVGQGHVDQFIAEMVQVGVSSDQHFVVNGHTYTFLDFVRESQARVRLTEEQELSWSIVAIGQCLGTNIEWTNKYGERLRFEDLVRYELTQDVEHAACGGTHRLFGLAWVNRLHRQTGGEMVGVWPDIDRKMASYQQRAKAWQNPDGTFSTNSFREPGNDPDRQVGISTTGHILEWLVLSLSDEELREPWVRHAVSGLCNLIQEIQDEPMEAGALYHALHALRMFAARHELAEQPL